MSEDDFDAVHGIRPGRHFYQFYKDFDDYLRVVIPYFRAGLEKGEACLWIVTSRWGLDQVKMRIQGLIPDGDPYLSSGQLILREAESWYLNTSGDFDEEGLILKAQQALQFALSQGYQILRGAGEASCIPRLDWPRMMAYEQNIAGWIAQQPVIGLCAYPIHDCTPTETRDVIACHDLSSR